MTSQAEMIEFLKGSQLCALPQSASQMIELAKDPENGPQEYAVPISADLGLATQVLRFVNSSFFGFRYKITSIQMALSLVSVRTIRNFVLWNGLYAVLPNPHCGPFSVKMLFQDALRRAAFAKLVTERYTKLDSDEAFSCALMQDMAIPILAQKWNREYTDMIQISNTLHVRLSTLERDRMGWDHADAGGFLALSWNLGEYVSRVVSQHTTDICAGLPSCQPTITSITALSAFLPKVTDSQWFEVTSFVDVFYRLFGPKMTEITEILSKTDAISGRLGGFSNLGTVSKFLSAYWRETLNSLPWTWPEDVMATEARLEEYFPQTTLHSR